MISHRLRSVLRPQSFRFFALAASCISTSLLLGQNQQAPVRSIEDGKAVYARSCSGCHGAEAYGTEHTPRLAGNHSLRTRSIEQLRTLIQYGIPASGMPAFRLPDPELDAIAAYVRSLNAPASEVIVPGDASAGGRAFWDERSCGSCHMIHGRGSPIGPDLSNVGATMTAEEIRDVLLHPDQRITSGYDLVAVKLRDGQILKGFARGRTNFDLQLEDLAGVFHLLQSADIVSIAGEPHSLMKPLSDSSEEIENLIAYLSRLTGIEPGALKETDRPDATKLHGIEFSRIQNPRPGDWPTYNGDLRGNRYSSLSHINAKNVKDLTAKWIFSVPHFGLEPTPIVVDGVMYFTGQNEAYAIDALSGRQIWRYSRPPTPGLVGDASLGTNRGVAVLGDKIFMVTDNAHLLALNSVTGSPVWEVVMPEQPEHYGSTVAPLIVNDTVVAGVSGGDWGMRGFIACYKAATGELLWRHWTLPAKGDPGIETWGQEPLFGGGSTWLTGTYDSETDTLYWPTGNPYPDSDDRDRPGDNLFTDCILALNARTGALTWYFQFTPHDTADRDANEPPVLIDTEYHGRPRKLLLQANRNGFFYVFDRTNGELLLAKSFLHRVNWTSGIGSDGRPLPPAQPAAPSREEQNCPNNAANWSSTAFSPTTRLYYVMTMEQCHRAETSGVAKTSDEPDGMNQKFMRAIDIDTGKVTWEIPQFGPVVSKTWPGVLATAGGVVFYGDPNGAFVAADERSGKTLWHFDTNVVMKASPMTYLAGGKQYIAVAAGSSILCFGLPSP